MKTSDVVLKSDNVFTLDLSPYLLWLWRRLESASLGLELRLQHELKIKPSKLTQTWCTIHLRCCHTWAPTGLFPGVGKLEGLETKFPSEVEGWSPVRVCPLTCLLTASHYVLSYTVNAKFLLHSDSTGFSWKSVDSDTDSSPVDSDSEPENLALVQFSSGISRVA